jgi:hypothetical protein
VRLEATRGIERRESASRLRRDFERGNRGERASARDVQLDFAVMNGSFSENRIYLVAVLWKRLQSMPARPVFRQATMAGRLVLAVACAGCIGGATGYSGTGSLTENGTTAAHLAFQGVVLSTCPPTQTTLGQAHSFRMLVVGGGCVIDAMDQDPFRPDPGAVCRLHFTDGTHVLRVTDVSIGYGLRGGVVTDRAYIDSTHLDMQIGGDDAQTGRHALYHFIGSSVEDPPPAPSCDDERLRRIVNVPGALAPPGEEPQR